MTTELMEKVLHMNHGTGETSYATNSFFQRKVIWMTKHITEEAINKLCNSSTTFPTNAHLAVADMGCSSGPNTFHAVSVIINAVNDLSKPAQPPEIQVFLNDLPSNDFNAVFRSPRRPNLTNEDTQEENKSSSSSSVFVNGVPGSFYGRLFPAKTLHFVHSSCSLQWLSRVPPGLEEINKGNVNIPTDGGGGGAVEEMYYGQFRRDFGKFLRCRGEEVVRGGRMVLTLFGRRSEEAGCYFWELFSLVLNHMASQGLIDQEKLNRFNIGEYMASPMEVETEVKKEGSFAIDRLEVSELSWDSLDDKRKSNVASDETTATICGDNMAKCIRAISEPLLVSQFGEGGVDVDEVFRRYRDIVSERMCSDEQIGSFVLVTVSLVNNSG